MDSNLEPFIDEYSYLTEVKCGDKTLSNVQINLRCSEVFPFKMTGKILGNSETYNKFTLLINNHNVDSLVLDSTGQPNQRYIIVINDLSLKKLTPILDCPKNSTLDFVEMDVYEIDIVDELIKFEERSMVFRVTGNSNIWFLGTTQNEDGKWTYLKNKMIDIKLEHGIRVSLSILEKSEQDNYNSLISIKYTLFSLRFDELNPNSHLSDKEFIKICKEYVENILLLASFNSGERIDWFCYKLFSKENLLTHIKRPLAIEKSSTKSYTMLAGRHSTYDFIERTYSQYVLLRGKSDDIRKAIINYLTSIEMKFIESRYITLFSALENLTEYHHEEQKYKDRIVSNKLFKKIQRSIKEALKSFNNDCQTIPVEEIFKKIPELNRISLSTVLSQLLAKYDLQLSDFYQSGEKETLLNTRNSLVHNGEEIDFDVLFNDFLRLKLIVELLILKMLNWNKFDQFIKNAKYLSIRTKIKPPPS